LGAKLTRFCTSNQSWLSLSYLVDWLITIAIIIVEISLSQYILAPHERYIPKSFQPLTYPIQEETIPLWMWVLMCILLPVLVFGAVQVGLRSAHDFHNACLGLFEGIAFNLVFTDLIRYFAGRNGPDWYDRVRAGVPSALKEGRLSFPSMHTSLAFATLTYLSAYMCGKLGVFRDDSGHMWKAFIAIIPIFGASLLSITRTMDYHNDFSDVLAGAVIGGIVGLLCYFLNYPSFFNNQCHEPKTRNEIYNKKRGILYETKDNDDESLTTPFVFSGETDQ